MALHLQIIVLTVVLTLYTVTGQPTQNSWFININTHKLFKLVEEGNFKYYDPRCTEEVLKQILNTHRVPDELIDTDAACKLLRSKILYMFRQLKD